MNASPRDAQTKPQRPLLLRLAFVVVALSLFAVACGSAEEPLDAAAGVEAIETNDGGVSVKPPDVLEDEPEDEVVADLPAPVEGLESTPIVPFAYFDGAESSTTAFTGRPTVLNFWASNCPACIAEMPDFEEVNIAFGGDVDFVGVNTADVSREAAVRLAEQTGVTYPLVDDSSSAIFRAFGGFVMPTTVLLNPQGQVAFSWSGVLNESELTRLINEHILSE